MSPAPPLAIDWAKELGLSWGDLLLVVLAAVGVYVGVVLLTRLSGPRSLASFSTFDIVVSVAMGSLVGRVVLVRTSLLAGLVGLAVLLVLQRLVRTLRDDEGVAVVDPRAHLLVWEGQLLDDGLERAHLSRRDLYTQLRASGIGSVTHVRAAIFERDAEISVITVDTPVDPELLRDVTGVPDGVVGAGG